MNLFGGFIAITRIAEGDFVGATWFIILASIFDGLDGAVARLTNSTSDLGVELDSLCDAVSFGLAPSFMIYQAHFITEPQYGLILAALPALAGTYRLARFNVQLSGSGDKRYFSGMPIPAGAITIISYTLFFHNGDLMPASWKPLAMTLVTIIVAIAMISTIKYDAFPRLSRKAIRERPFVFAMFVAGAIAIVVTRGEFLFPFMVLYIVFGMLRSFVFWLRDRAVSDEDDDVLEQSEPSPFDM